MDWLDSKYAGMLSSRLRNYKRRGPELLNFSCPLCGDSERDKRKARAYIYVKQGKTLYHCHNCNRTQAFRNFLKDIDTQLYSEYSLERLKSDGAVKKQSDDLTDFVAKMKRPAFLKSGPLSKLRKVSQLSADHPTKQFVVDRKIPNPYHAKLFHCPRFFEWSNEIVPEKFSDEALLYDEPRLLIPFLDKDETMHAFQGRSLDSTSKTRYITIVNDESKPKLYGLDSVDFNKKVYVFEGPIDSMFVPNSIATAGGDLTSAVNGLDKSKLVVVYDNEPRSAETRAKIEKAVINGYSVCVWPSNLEHKDVNDCVKAGLTSDFVRYIIDTHTYRDLSARAALVQWSKSA